MTLIVLLESLDDGRGAHQRKCKTIEEFAPPKKRLESTTTTIRGPFAFSSPAGKVDQRKWSPLPTAMPSWSKSHFTSKGARSKKNFREGRFLLCLLLSKGQGEIASLSFGSSFGFPRIAVAGAKPAFFVFRMREKVEEKHVLSLRDPKVENDSILWAHRIKRSALSWQEILGLVGASSITNRPRRIKAFIPRR
ncbi:hypothetical protein DH2020_048817 [Rehmannia glutinosa]|uniref:Uncharacterized protein n=1 Tax=Rehmannia glutinosa TaxID=99300 RepID=A0ABR0U4L9_REHGL